MKSEYLRSGCVALVIGVVVGCTTHSGPRVIATEKLEPYECGSMSKLHTLGGVFLASQPQPADFEEARKAGIKTVMNLRHPDEIKAFNEEAVVIGLGLHYVNPSWNGPEELTDETFEALRVLLKTAERPILLHCGSANRVGAVWLPYRVLDEGILYEQALQEAKTVGLTSPGYEAKAKDYINRMKK
jgi:uncharacterized protein (TIGR01244 family)